MTSVCGNVPVEIPILWPRASMVGPRPRAVMVGPRPCVVMVGPRSRLLLTPPLTEKIYFLTINNSGALLTTVGNDTLNSAI
jgi:hypothetical protein